MKRVTSHLCALSVLASVSFGQAVAPKPPCDFSGELLRDAKGKVVLFASDEMKRRVIQKVDVSDFMKRVDINGTAVVDILVGPSGEVVCVKSLTGHPILRVEVEKALRQWTFKPAEVAGKGTAYLGRLEFMLCNISCGKEGPSMTILK
jgi:hypothetical protein